MIARIWDGETPVDKADAFLKQLEDGGLKEIKATEGNEGMYLLTRNKGETVEFVLVTLWSSMDAVKRFAGPEPEKAVYHDNDTDLLIELKPTVAHYEVVRS